MRRWCYISFSIFLLMGSKSLRAPPYHQLHAGIPISSRVPGRNRQDFILYTCFTPSICSSLYRSRTKLHSLYSFNLKFVFSTRWFWLLYYINTRRYKFKLIYINYVYFKLEIVYNSYLIINEFHILPHLLRV
jgi:hypothetical protein